MFRIHWLTDEHYAAIKSKFWGCSWLNCDVSNMHSLLDRSVPWGHGCFWTDFRSFLQVTSNMSEQCIDKYRQRIYYYLVKFSGTLHRWLQRYHTRIRTLRSSLVCFGCSKEPSHWDGSFEYPQHMFWLKNKKINFLLPTLNNILNFEKKSADDNKNRKTYPACKELRIIFCLFCRPLVSLHLSHPAGSWSLWRLRRSRSPSSQFQQSLSGVSLKS